MEEIKKSTISEEELDKVVDTLKENKAEETLNMEHSISDERVQQFIEEESGEDPYQKQLRDVSLTDEDFEKLLNAEGQSIPSMAKSLFDINIEEGDVIKSSDEDINSQIDKNVRSMFDDLEETEMLDFLEVIRSYRAGNRTGIFARLPKTIKNMIISSMAQENIVDPRAYNEFAKEFIGSIVDQSEQDQAFIDIEKSLDEALKLPSLGDMYADHTEKVMNEEIPRIIEEIKDTEPENAEKLIKIQEQFKDSYTLSSLKTHYNENARTRKLMRRDWKSVAKFAEEFNLRNSHSQFKMPDAKTAGPALFKTFVQFIEDRNAAIARGLDPGELTEVQQRIVDMKMDDEILCKFLVLFYRSVIEKDPNNLYDAAYMYYALRNLTMLGLTNENKTSFTVELINNICDIIEFIRGKEAEFNAAQLSAGSSKKGKRKEKRK